MSDIWADEVMLVRCVEENVEFEEFVEKVSSLGSSFGCPVYGIYDGKSYISDKNGTVTKIKESERGF